MFNPQPRRRPHRRLQALLAVMAVLAVVGLGLPSSAASGRAEAKAPSAPWLDAHKSIADRVDALLNVMTLAEKVGQMDQQLVTTLTDPSSATCGDSGFNLPNPACMQKILIDSKTGSVLAGGTNNPIDTTGGGGV
ncbi:MAG: beta-glucosidase, partial [Pseudonocardiales bacterium]|nr:beta-glucosidase [Pseudonocardiales bacterium]